MFNNIGYKKGGLPSVEEKSTHCMTKLFFESSQKVQPNDAKWPLDSPAVSNWNV